MGDGVQNKFALILNGDTEARHLENVDRAINALRKEAPYQISVASTSAPKDVHASFQPATEIGLRNLIDGLAHQMDDDDLLVFYTTGHGDVGNNGEGCVALPQGCFSLATLNDELKKIKYGQRIVVMDQCYGGRSLPLFENPKTAIVTQSSPGEQVSCQMFAPYFWSDQVPDKDGDGIITIQERYEYAMDTGQTTSLTQSLIYDPIALSGKSGKHPFNTPDSLPIVVHNKKELDQQLKKIKPGQLALVMFGADWCAPCHAYQPFFEKLSKTYDGRFLMIRAEGVKGSAEDWVKAYHFTQWPTVAFIDSRDRFTIVPDRMDPLKTLGMAALMDPAQEFEAVLRLANSAGPDGAAKAKEIFETLMKYYPEVIFPKCLEILEQPESSQFSFVSERLDKKIYENRKILKKHLPKIIQLLSHSSPKVRAVAAGLTREFYELAWEAVDPLVDLVFDKDAKVRASASTSLGFILGEMEEEQSKSTIDRLIGFLNSSNPEEQRYVLDTFYIIPNKALPYFSTFLKKMDDPEPLVRIGVLNLITEMQIEGALQGDQPELVKKIIEKLQDANLDVRREAARNLLLLGNLREEVLAKDKKTELHPRRSSLYIFKILPALLKFFPEDPKRKWTQIGSYLTATPNEAAQLEDLFAISFREFSNHYEVIKTLTEKFKILSTDKNSQLRSRALFYLKFLIRLEKSPNVEDSGNWSLGTHHQFGQFNQKLHEGIDLFAAYQLSRRWQLRAHGKLVYFPELRNDITIEPLTYLGHSTKPLAILAPLMETGLFHYWDKKITGLAVNPIGLGWRWEPTGHLALEAMVKFSLKIPFHGPVTPGAEENLGLTWTP